MHTAREGATCPSKCKDSVVHGVFVEKPRGQGGWKRSGGQKRAHKIRAVRGLGKSKQGFSPPPGFGFPLTGKHLEQKSDAPLTGKRDPPFCGMEQRGAERGAAAEQADAIAESRGGGGSGQGGTCRERGSVESLGTFWRYNQ